MSDKLTVKSPSESTSTTREFGYFSQSENGILRSGLKLIHIRLLVAIEDHGQVSIAAETLNMTQPAASRMLTEMEAIMKCQLCKRASRGVVLTQFGKALAKRGRKILLELRDADREISQLKLGNGGSIHIGAVSAPSMSLVVPAVTAAISKFPGIEINVEVENSNVLIRDLISAKFDFVIGRIPDDVHPSPFNVQEIGVEKACFLVRQGHPLQSKQQIDMSEMSQFDWVFQPEGTLLRRAVEDIFLQQKIPSPRNVINTPSIILGLALLQDSDCIMPISQDMAAFLVDQDSRIGKIAQLKTTFDLAVRPYGLITMKDRILTPSAQLLFDLIENEAKQLIASSAQS